VQVIAWKDSHIMCRAGHKTTHSLSFFVYFFKGYVVETKGADNYTPPCTMFYFSVRVW